MSVLLHHLCVEYREQPLGINARCPRLSWDALADERMQTQTAYQIVVSEDEKQVVSGQGEQWDSGKVFSHQAAQIVYAGLPLRSGTRYYWRVSVWYGEDESPVWSHATWWEMGLLEAEDWTAQWITAPRELMHEEICPQFRRSFALARPVIRARLAICGLGQYELSVNGQRVSEHVLEPGWSNYRKVCLYKMYDVTTFLQTGENVLGVLLGNGMYRVLESERYTKFTGSFGDLKLIAQLDLLLDDGTTVRLGTDGQWKASLSALTFSSIYGGEDYDARQEQAGWNAPDFQEGSQWYQAEITQGPGGVLQAQQHPSPKVWRTFHPVNWTRLEADRYLVDFGQNFAGWVRLAVRGVAGAQVKITPSELLNDGMVDQSEIGTPVYYQYTLKGDGAGEEWHPRFTYYGLRYALVEGAVPVELSEPSSLDLPILEAVTGEMISADIQSVGAFSCSNEMINRIHHLIVMAMRSNMQSILTDCPQREKLGWLEQVYLMGPSLMSNYVVPTLYTTMIEQMRDAQLENGLVPNIAPEYAVFDGGFRDSPEWGSVCILAPWLMYQYYQDRILLAEQYLVMQRYLDYLGTQATDHILDHGLGDWCDIGPETPYPSQTPRALTATAFYYYDAALLAQISTLLHKPAEAERYQRLAEEIKEAFTTRFFDREQLTYATGSQAANALPLVFGMVDPSNRLAVLDAIVRDIQARGNHTTAGDIGYRFVLQALTQYDRSDVVYALSQQTEDPSYGFQLAHGATTLTEKWDGPVRGDSQNHLMLGHIEEWFYSGLAGIRVDFTANPPLTIKPTFVGDLRWVQASQEVPGGRIAVAWERETAERFRLSVTIPPNMPAQLVLPPEHVASVIEEGNALPLCIEGNVLVCVLKSGTSLFTGTITTVDQEHWSPRD